MSFIIERSAVWFEWKVKKSFQNFELRGGEEQKQRRVLRREQNHNRSKGAGRSGQMEKNNYSFNMFAYKTW